MTRARRHRGAALAGIVVRTIAAALVAWIVVTALAVTALRWFAPPLTAVMLEQPGPLHDLRYEWVGPAATSPQAPLAR